MTPSEQARAEVEAWVKSLNMKGAELFDSETDNLIARLTPVFQQAKDGRSVVADAAIERAERAEATVERLRELLRLCLEAMYAWGHEEGGIPEHAHRVVDEAKAALGAVPAEGKEKP